MFPQDTITLALAALATLIFIRLILSNVFAILGIVILKNGYAGGPEDSNCYWPSRVDDDLYHEMLALGFQPLGTYWEQLPFTRRFEEFVFTRRGEKCFGILYPNNQIMPRRASFFTVFETGGVVFTKNYCGGVEVQQGDFLATGAATPPVRDLPPAAAGSFWRPIAFCLAAVLLAVMAYRGSDLWPGSDQRVMFWLGGLAVSALLVLFRPRWPVQRALERKPDDHDLRIPLVETLARHRLNVDRLLAAGQHLPGAFDGEEFLAAQRRYHRHPLLRGQFQAAMAMLLVIKLIALLPLPAFFFYTRGIHDPLPWSILLAEGLAGLYLRYGCSSATVINMLRGARGRVRRSG